MIQYVSGADQSRHRQLFERLFRLRYQVFIQQRQWALPACNGLERDYYDCPKAAYFFEEDVDGTIISHVRLTPTRTHSLLADCFPHLVEGDIDPRGDTIWEATRYVVRPARKSRHANRASKAKLVERMLEWCLEQGITHIQVVIDTYTLPTFLEMTSKTLLLGLSHAFGGGPGVTGGGECIAWRWPVTIGVINDIRSYGGLPVPPCANLDRQLAASQAV